MAQEGRKVKPIPPTTPSPFTDRNTSRTILTSLKPAEDFFFPQLYPRICYYFQPFLLFLFLLPSILYLFHSFFLPSFIYCFVLKLLKLLLILAPTFLYSFFLPSFPFLFPFQLLPFSFFFSPVSLFLTSETIKPEC